MVLFATSGGTAHVRDPALFRHAPTVLHLSLRDLWVEVVLAAQNVDDADHCLKAQTSLHLAEQAVGSRDIAIARRFGNERDSRFFPAALCRLSPLRGMPALAAQRDVQSFNRPKS